MTYILKTKIEEYLRNMNEEDEVFLKQMYTLFKRHAEKKLARKGA